VVEEPEASASERDLVFTAGMLDLCGPDRAAWLGDVADAVPVGMVDVVAEWQSAVRDERDFLEARQPLRTPPVREVRGLFDRHGIDIVIGLVMALCFAYEFTGIVPGAEDVSWQGHLFGFITGIVGGWIFRERRPKPHTETDPPALAGPTTPALGPTKPAL
jgi:hypothetical protein